MALNANNSKIGARPKSNKLTIYLQMDVHGVNYRTLLSVKHDVGRPLRRTCQETEEVITEESGKWKGKWTRGQ